MFRFKPLAKIPDDTVLRNALYELVQKELVLVNFETPEPSTATYYLWGSDLFVLLEGHLLFSQQQVAGLTFELDVKVIPSPSVDPKLPNALIEVSYFF